MTFNKSQKQLISVDIINAIDITNDFIEEGESEISAKLLKREINGKSPFDEFLSVSPKKVSKKKK